MSIESAIQRVSRIRAGENAWDVYANCDGACDPRTDDLRRLAFAYLDHLHSLDSTQTILRGANGQVIATVENPEDARLFATASALQDALLDLRADMFLQLEPKLGPQRASEYPSIQKADMALKVAGPKRSPGMP